MVNFTTRGPVDPTDERLYVVRPHVDDVVKQELKRGHIIALIGPRQTGKTSLLLKLRLHLSTESGYQPIYLDVSPVETKSSEAWFDYLLNSMVSQAKSGTPNFVPDAERDQLGFRKIISFLAKSIESSNRIVFMIDELGTIPPSVRYPFLSTIREIYVNRYVEPSFQKLSFVLGGTYLPDDLIKGAASPFNVAKEVYTIDSDRQGVKQIVGVFEDSGKLVTEEAIDQVYAWTHGHLYLTQRICEIIEERWPHSRQISRPLVDNAVDHLLRFGDINLAHVLGVLEERPELYEHTRKLLDGSLRQYFSLTSTTLARLDLLGVIRKDEGNFCVIRNRVYEHALRMLYDSGVVPYTEHVFVEVPSKKIEDTIQRPTYHQASGSIDYDDLEVIIDAEKSIRVMSKHEGETKPEKLEISSQHERYIHLGIKMIENGLDNEEFIKETGRSLFEALFTKSVLGIFEASLSRSRQAERKGVRIRLTVDDSEMASWPWELLYDAERNLFLANSEETTLSRYLHVREPQRLIRSRSPLRVLVVISSPAGVPKLDVEEEERLIGNALQGLINVGHVQVEVSRDSTLLGLRRILDGEGFNVVHFVGHGEFEKDKGLLALKGTHGDVRWVDDEQFANLFLGSKHVGLIILNSCQGAKQSTNRSFGGMAPALVQRGIPAVVAMQYPISDSTAKLFSQEFYAYLAKGYPVDVAVQKTRNAIYMEKPGQRDFATPVLFMRARDGRVFEP